MMPLGQAKPPWFKKNQRAPYSNTTWPLNLCTYAVHKYSTNRQKTEGKSNYINVSTVPTESQTRGWNNGRSRSREQRNSGFSRKSRKSGTSGLPDNKTWGITGSLREEASKRQANSQKGKHEKLYRKVGYIVWCGPLERSMEWNPTLVKLCRYCFCIKKKWYVYVQLALAK